MHALMTRDRFLTEALIMLVNNKGTTSPAGECIHIFIYTCIKGVAVHVAMLLLCFHVISCSHQFLQAGSCNG